MLMSGDASVLLTAGAPSAPAPLLASCALMPLCAAWKQPTATRRRTVHVRKDHIELGDASSMITTSRFIGTRKVP